MPIRTRLPALAVLALLVAGSGPAWAHAHLQAATPAPDSTVGGAPAKVTIALTESIEPQFSHIEVRDAAGQRVDEGASAATGNSLSVGLRVLPPGTYQVGWQVTAVDTHKTSGTFQFTVGS
jgi:methionine-rich copper-binding protein CopC